MGRGMRTDMGRAGDECDQSMTVQKFSKNGLKQFHLKQITHEVHLTES